MALARTLWWAGRRYADNVVARRHRDLEGQAVRGALECRGRRLRARGCRAAVRLDAVAVGSEGAGGGVAAVRLGTEEFGW